MRPERARPRRSGPAGLSFRWISFSCGWFLVFVCGVGTRGTARSKLAKLPRNLATRGKGVYCDLWPHNLTFSWRRRYVFVPFPDCRAFTLIALGLHHLPSSRAACSAPVNPLLQRAILSP